MQSAKHAWVCANDRLRLGAKMIGHFIAYRISEVNNEMTGTI